MQKRKVEVFSAGCPACDEKIQEVKAEACPSCDIEVKDMKVPAVAKAAKALGITRVPAVVINGVLADCCKQGPIDIVQLKRLGLGQA